MKEIKEMCYKGTRILVGNEKRSLVGKMCDYLTEEGFTEIIIPVIQHRTIFTSKVGEENNNLMFNFQDRGGRDICLAPEYTAVIQQLAKTTYKYEKDVKLFYVQECFRGEKPQKGRYRQFTQLGVEVINPTKDHNLCYHALRLLSERVDTRTLRKNSNVSRGLDYYTGGIGFEISAPILGSSSQICGGGEYDGGCGFAIGIDRVLLL